MEKKISLSHLLPGVYAPGHSLLHKTPVNWKISIGLALLSLTTLGRWLGIVFVALACIAGLYLAGIAIHAIWKRLRTFVWFILFLGIFPIFFTPGPPIEVMAGHSLNLTWEGLEAGGLFICRMVLMFMVSMIFMHTTRPADIFALQKSGVGDEKGLRAFFREAGMVGLMAFQLLPILFDEVEKRLVMELNENKINGNIFNKARQVAYLLIPLTTFVFENTELFSKQLNKTDRRPEQE